VVRMWRILSDFLGMGFLYSFTIKGRYLELEGLAKVLFQDLALNFFQMVGFLMYKTIIHGAGRNYLMQLID
jgi:hypothetical protein